MNDLELYREELANCDAKITEALKERYAIIEKIMAYKEEYGMPILLAEQDEEKQIQNLSQTMAELNIIHPFREGNGRSTRELIRCMALEYGLHINWGNTDRETLINAAIAAVDDDMAFCDVLRQCIE